MKDIPAFPRTQSPNETGMTLRDYFAARAMQGQLSIFENVIALAREQIKLEDVCIASYEVADAMMKARTE
jgi:hypothetical protein